jgi:hypothetical protein
MSPAMYAIGIAMKLAIVLSGCMADFVWQQALVNHHYPHINKAPKKT